MFKFRFLFIIILSIFLNQVIENKLVAQDTLTKNTLLWEISGKGIKKSSYLYGTIHIQDRRVFQYADVVTEKLKSCDAYAMEVLIDRVTAEELKKAILIENNSLDKLLSPDDYKLLDRQIKKKLKSSILMFNKMKPFFISAQLMQVDMNKDMPMALDMHFLEMAKKENKKILGLEKFQEQVATVDKIPLETQCKMMMESIKDSSKIESDGYNRMIETYKQGDLSAIVKLTEDTAYGDNFSAEFVTIRNINMSKTIARAAKQQSTFIAVGAAHLGGKNGIIELLGKAGFIVKPVVAGFKE